MDKHKNRLYPNLIVSFLLGFLIWLFFAVYYRHHLHYQEQMQLFLYTTDYFTGLVSHPGGLAMYLGRFVTQFFYHSSGGALILALLLVALRMLVSEISFQIAGKRLYQLLSCLPPLLFVLLFCDEDMLVSGLIATLIVLTATLFYKSLKQDALRITYLLLMIPSLYWLAGYSVFLFVALCLIIEWLVLKTIKKRTLGFISLAAAGLLLSVPFASKFLLPQYPMMRLWFAGDYYRFVTHIKPDILFTLLSIIIIPVLCRWLPDAKTRKWRIAVHTVQAVLLFLAVEWILAFGADWEKEELMGYDYYVRTQRWPNIIAKANEISPDSPQTVAALNLALSKRGYMGDYMFYYYQNGSDGLIPNHTVDFILPMMIGEIYYHLGLVNSAQRFTFEAMESIPDYPKSVRCFQRLAETNLINGQYDVAGKYLAILQHTLFYKDWAKEAVSYLRDEKRIDSHPEWGQLRRFMLQRDFLFVNEDKQMLLAALLERDPENKTAYSYLLAQNLLDIDLVNFRSNLKKGIVAGGYEKLPVSYQEALAFSQDPAEADDAMASGISDEVWQRYKAFRQIISSQKASEIAIRKDFGSTYWYYLCTKGAIKPIVYD